MKINPKLIILIDVEGFKNSVENFQNCINVLQYERNVLAKPLEVSC